MKTRILSFLILLAMAAPSSIPAETSPRPRSHLDWQPWSDAVFTQAKREKRFVLLDLEAVWCHWCHVMD
jgi:uncharacterized protein YyaL (SSP411 family)